jgi:hypothetical protein
MRSFLKLLAKRILTPTTIVHFIENEMIARQARYLIPFKEEKLKREVVHRNPTRTLFLLRNLIVQNYDFLGVTKRMEESLAVMVLL